MSTIILIGIVWLLMINTVTAEPKEWSNYLLMASHKYKMGSPKNMSKSYIFTKEMRNPWRCVKGDWIKNHHSINFYTHRKQPLTIEKSDSKPIVSLALESKTLSKSLKLDNSDLYTKKHKRRCQTGYYNFKLDLCEQRPLKLKSFIRSHFFSRNNRMHNNKNMPFTKMTHNFMRPRERGKTKKMKFNFQMYKDKENLINPEINIKYSPQSQFPEEGNAYQESSSRLQPITYSRTNFKSPYGTSEDKEFIKDSSNLHPGNRLNYFTNIFYDDDRYKMNEIPSPQIRKDVYKASHLCKSNEYMLDCDSPQIIKQLHRSNTIQYNKNGDMKSFLVSSPDGEYKLYNIDALRNSKNFRFMPKNPSYYYKTNNQNFNQYRGQPNNYNYANRRHTQNKLNPLHTFRYDSLHYGDREMAKNKIHSEHEHKNFLHKYANEIHSIEQQNRFNNIMYKVQHSAGGEHEGTIAGKLISGLLHGNGTLSIPALNGLNENQITEGLVEGPMTPAYDDTYPDSMSFDYSPQDFELSQPLAEEYGETISNSSEIFENPYIFSNLQIKNSENANKPGVEELTLQKQVHNTEVLPAQLLSGDITYMPHDEINIRVKQFMEPNFSKLELGIPHDIPIFNQSSNVQESEREDNGNTIGTSESEVNNETTVFVGKGNTDFAAGYTESISAENTTVFESISVTEQMHSSAEVSNEADTELAQEDTTNTEVSESNTEINTGSSDVYDIPPSNSLSTCSTPDANNANNSIPDKVYFVISGTLYGKKVTDKTITENSHVDVELSADSKKSNVTKNSSDTMVLVYENSVNNSITTPMTLHNEKTMIGKVKLSDSLSAKKSKTQPHASFVSHLQQNHHLQRKTKLSSVSNFPLKQRRTLNPINSNKIKNILLLKSHIIQEKLRPVRKRKNTKTYVYEPKQLQGTLNINEASLIDNNIDYEIPNDPLNFNVKSSVVLEKGIKSMGNKIGLHTGKNSEIIQKKELESNEIKNTDTQIEKENIFNNMFSISSRKINDIVCPSCNSGKDNVIGWAENNEFSVDRTTNHEMLNNKQKGNELDRNSVSNYNSEQNLRQSIKYLKQQTVTPFKFDPQYYHEIYDMGGRHVMKKELKPHQNTNEEENDKNIETHKIDINNEKYKTFILELPHIINELIKHLMGGKNVDSATIKLEIEPVSQDFKDSNVSQVILKFNNENPDRDQGNFSFSLVPQQTNTSNVSAKQIDSSISDKLSPTINVAANENKTQFHLDESETLHPEKTFNHSTVMNKENKIKDSNKDNVGFILPKNSEDKYSDNFHESIKPLNIKITVWPHNQQPTSKFNSARSHVISIARDNKQYLSDSGKKEPANNLKRIMVPANAANENETQFHSGESETLHPEKAFNRSTVMNKENKIKDSNKDNVGFILPKKSEYKYSDNFHESIKPLNIKITVWPHNQQLISKFNSPSSHVMSIARDNKQYLSDSGKKEPANNLKRIMVPANAQLVCDRQGRCFSSIPQYISINIYPPLLPVHDRRNINTDKPYDSPNDNSYSSHSEKQQIWRKRNILSMEETIPLDENGEAITDPNERNTFIGQLNSNTNSESTHKYCLIQQLTQEDNTSSFIYLLLFYHPYTIYDTKEKCNKFEFILIKTVLTSLKQHFTITKHSTIYFSCFGVGNSFNTNLSRGQYFKIIFRMRKIGFSISKNFEGQIYTRRKLILGKNEAKDEFPTVFFQHASKILQVLNEPRMKYFTCQIFLCPCQYFHGYMFPQKNCSILKLYTKHLPNQKQNLKFSYSDKKLRAVGSSKLVNNFTNKKMNGLCKNNTNAIRKYHSQNKKYMTSNDRVSKHKPFHNKIDQKSNKRQYTNKLYSVNDGIPSNLFGFHPCLLHKTLNMHGQQSTFKINHSPKYMHQIYFCAISQTGSVQKHKWSFKGKSIIKHAITDIKIARIKPIINKISNEVRKIRRKNYKTNRYLSDFNKWHSKKTKKKHQICSKKHLRQIYLFRGELLNPNTSMAGANFSLLIINIRHRIQKVSTSNTTFEPCGKNENIKNTISEHPLNQANAKHSIYSLSPRTMIKNKKYANFGKKGIIHSNVHTRKLHAFFEKPNMKNEYLNYPRKIHQLPNNTQLKTLRSVYTHYMALNSSEENNSEDANFYENPKTTQFDSLHGDVVENNLTYLRKLNIFIHGNDNVKNHTNINKKPSHFITKIEINTQNPGNPGFTILANNLNEVFNIGISDQPLLASNQRTLPLLKTNISFHYINEWEKTHKSDMPTLRVARNKRSIKNSMQDKSFSEPQTKNDIKHMLTDVKKMKYRPDIVNFSENNIKTYYDRYPSIVDYLRRLKHGHKYNHNRTSIRLKQLHKKRNFSRYKNEKINYSSNVVNDSVVSDIPRFPNNPVGIQNDLVLNVDLNTEFGSKWLNRDTRKNSNADHMPLKYEYDSSYIKMKPVLEENNANFLENQYLDQSSQIERPDLTNDSADFFILGTSLRPTNAKSNVLTLNPTLKAELQKPVQEESNELISGNLDYLEQIVKTEDINFSDDNFSKYVPYFENTPMVDTLSYEYAHKNEFMQLSSVTKQSWITENNQPMSTEPLTKDTADTTSVQDITSEQTINTDEDMTATAYAKYADSSSHLTKINESSIDFLSIIEPQSTLENIDSRSETVTVTVQQVITHSNNYINKNFIAELDNENSVGTESTAESTTFKSIPQSIETTISQYTEMESSLGPETVSSFHATELETFQESATSLISSQLTETAHGLTVTANSLSTETESVNLHETNTETEQQPVSIGETSQFISQNNSNMFTTQQSHLTSHLNNPTESSPFSALNENELDITESSTTITTTIQQLLLNDDYSTIHYTSPQITTSLSVQKTEQIFEETEPDQNQTNEANNNFSTPNNFVSDIQTLLIKNTVVQVSETDFISVKSQSTGTVYVTTETSLTPQEEYRNSLMEETTTVLKENEHSTHIEEMETAPVTQIHVPPSYDMDLTSHLNNFNYSDQNTSTNNITIQHTDRCEIEDSTCHCVLSMMFDELAFLASTKANFSSYLSHYQCKKTSFNETQLMLSDFDMLTDLHKTADNFVEGKLKVLNYTDLPKYSTNTSSDDANQTVLIGSNVEIMCTRSIDMFSIGQGSISFNWKFSAADIFSENVGEPVSGQELSLHNISLKEEGTYTCEVQSEEQENDDIAQFSHQVSVVGLPIYIIKIKMAYTRSQQCDEDDLILVKQLTSMLNNLVCGKVCVIWIPEVKCINEDNVTLQYITIFCEIKHIYEMIPLINNIICDVQCSAYLDKIFLVGVHNDLQYFLTIPVSYRSSNSVVNIVPVLKQFNITLLQGCGLGYGLYENLCVPCPPQFYGSSDTYKCKPCEKGTYQPQKGSELCIPCPHPFAASTCHILVQERYSFIAAVCIFGILILTTVCCCSIVIYLRCKQRKNKRIPEPPGYFKYDTDSIFQQPETVPLLPIKEVNEYSELHSAVQIEDDEVTRENGSNNYHANTKYIKDESNKDSHVNKQDDISIFMEENGEKLHSYLVSHHIASETETMYNSPGMIKFRTRKRRPPVPPLDF